MYKIATRFKIMFYRFFCLWQNPDGCTLEFNRKFKFLITFYEYMHAYFYFLVSFFKI